LVLDHALRPWSSWLNRSVLPPAANAYQAIQRKSRSRRGKHKKEARDAQERIAAVRDQGISLLYGRQAEEYHHAADTRPHPRRKQHSEA
jgi:hypothetical protein